MRRPRADHQTLAERSERSIDQLQTRGMARVQEAPDLEGRFVTEPSRQLVERDALLA
jgi:hypothetical protein